mgnify:CR=1 FL=1
MKVAILNDTHCGVRNSSDIFLNYQLCSLKELLGYFTSNVNIIMKPTVLDYDGLGVAVIPWINNANYNEYVDFAKNCKAAILGAHLELKGFDLMPGMPNPHGMSADIFQRFEQVLKQERLHQYVILLLYLRSLSMTILRQIILI